MCRFVLELREFNERPQTPPTIRFQVDTEGTGRLRRINKIFIEDFGGSAIPQSDYPVNYNIESGHSVLSNLSDRELRRIGGEFPWAVAGVPIEGDNLA